MNRDESSDSLEPEFCDYIGSCLCIGSDPEEEKICREIIHHKHLLDKRLGRDIGIEVALLDYIKNINQKVHIPAVFDSPEIKKINHHHKNNHRNIKYYDTSILSDDINIEIERAHRYGSPFSVLMFDFEVENDLLLNMCRNIRFTDTIYKYQNNRYVLLLPETDTNEAIKAAYKIQKWSRSQKIDEISLSLLISIGVAAYGFHDIDTEYKILAAADEALRKARNAGRGKICLFQSKGILEITEKESESLPAEKILSRLQFQGIPIHSGIAIGTVFIYNDLLSHELESYDISDENLEFEFKRIAEAIHNVEKDLIDMEHLVDNDLSTEYAAIFQAHRLILKDNQILDEIKKTLYEKKANGEAIVRDVFKRWENRFLAFEDEIFRNKSQDIADISRRIIKELKGIDSHILERAPSESIIFANRMLPSDTVNLNKKNIKAIVTKEGSRFSHTAILSKAMNIPLVIVEDLNLAQFGHNEVVYVDGNKGLVVVNPSSEEELKTLKVIEYNLLNEKNNLMTKEVELFYRGEKVSILAAASNLDETRESILYNADGIGLFRMEVFYLTQNILPDEDTLVRGIDRILDPCKSKEIIIRLLDIGGDKNLSYINNTERYNSSLGMRGVRMFKKHPHLLETQLRALSKVSRKYSIKILIPMVTLVDDILFVKDMYAKIQKALKIRNEIPIGTMIETPSAVLAIDSVLEHSDFVSIGTNDLIQYTMAADREKLSVSRYYEEGGRVIQDFIRIINEKSRNKNIPCFLCGELAQNPDFTEDLLIKGCRNFTVTSSIIPQFRKNLLKYTNL